MKPIQFQTILIALILFVGCGGKSAKQTAENIDVSYQTYCNNRYDYCVDYPDFLIPQGETDAGDGQQFISENKQNSMIVYRTFKAITGDNPTVKDAYEEDLQIVAAATLTDKKLEESYYYFAGKTDGDKLFKQYTIFANNDYFVIRFEYDKAESELFNAVAKHVSESFNVGNPSESSDAEDAFSQTIFDFINDCYDGHNFNALLRDNDPHLAKYIDPRMDIRRYYNPGAVAYLYTREQNFGFGDWDDFQTEFMFGGEYTLKPLDVHPCEIEGKENSRTVYYQVADEFPLEVISTETLETREVSIPYPTAEKMAVYILNQYNNPRGFYFVKTPSGWKLAFVDDALCGA